MNCPMCNYRLPPLAAFLAQTYVGTQCPNCWTLLRQLAPPREPEAEETEPAPPAERKRAA